MALQGGHGNTKSVESPHSTRDDLSITKKCSVVLEKLTPDQKRFLSKSQETLLDLAETEVRDSSISGSCISELDQPTTSCALERLYPQQINVVSNPPINTAVGSIIENGATSISAISERTNPARRTLALVYDKIELNTFSQENSNSEQEIASLPAMGSNNSGLGHVNDDIPDLITGISFKL